LREGVKTLSDNVNKGFSEILGRIDEMDEELSNPPDESGAVRNPPVASGANTDLTVSADGISPHYAAAFRNIDKQIASASDLASPSKFYRQIVEILIDKQIASASDLAREDTTSRLASGQD
jgi:hypothetical protein